MADDASYATFLQRANNPPSAPSTSTQASSINEPSTLKHPFLPLLNDSLANLSTKTFVTETDSDFSATFISSSALTSWSDSTDEFPEAVDIEGQVEGGRNGEMMSIKEWDLRETYTAVIKVVRDVTKQKDL